MKTEPAVSQRTLTSEFRLCGRGMHTGQTISMTVCPGEPDTGICFLRSDQPPARALILARWSNVVRAEQSTDLGNSAGVSVGSVEHIMAAFRLGGVDNALVVLNGPEIPGLDVGAAAFLDLIERAGIAEQDAPARTIVLIQSVQVREGDRYARLTPSVNPRLTVTVDHPIAPSGLQSIATVWDLELLKRALARPRLATDAEALLVRRRGLEPDLGKGLPTSERIGNRPSLTDHEELVRHQALDAIGDLYLAGCPMRANYDGFRPDHRLNVRLLRQALGQSSHVWTVVPMRTRTGGEPKTAAALLHA